MQLKNAGVVYRRASGALWTIRRLRIFAFKAGLTSEIKELSARIDATLRDSKPLGIRPWVVTSTLHTSSKPLSYSSTRSVFSFEDRLSQTQETVASLAAATQRAPIVLLDLSLTLADEEIPAIYLGLCAVPSTQGLNTLRELARGPYKGLAEAMLLLSALESRSLTVDGFWKISGRYHLTEDSLVRSVPKPTGITGVVRDYAMNTTCFSVSPSAVEELRAAIWRSVPDQLVGRSFETSLYRWLRHSDNLNSVPGIGVSGLIAVSGEPFTL